jgi:hypothetical protein
MPSIAASVVKITIFGWKYKAQNWTYWNWPLSFRHFAIIHVHQFVWFVVKKRATSQVVEHHIGSSPWFVCSFIANTFSTHITPLHVTHTCSISNWLPLHNGSHTTYFKQVANFGLLRDYYSWCLFHAHNIQQKHFVPNVSMSDTKHSSSHMQGMDRKYNGHTWSKVITTNIKNMFGLSFRKVWCLGHLHYV